LDIIESVHFYTKFPSVIWGLSFLPYPVFSNEKGEEQNPVISSRKNSVEEEISQKERDVFKEVCQPYKQRPINIMEIGVDRNNENSFTRILLDKHPDSKYVGVDLKDKSYLDDDKKNIFTLECSSFDGNCVMNFLWQKKISNLDILFIDGDHSINGCLIDWTYSKLINPGGCIIFHDVHTYPGPYCLMNAISSKFFDVKRLTNETDGVNGIGVAYRNEVYPVEIINNSFIEQK
jgi:hypothetical protein